MTGIMSTYDLAYLTLVADTQTGHGNISRERQSQRNRDSHLAVGATTLLLIGTLVVVAHLPQASARSSSEAGAGPTTSQAVFERRILPLLRANNPSTCSECHLSGVDLKDYIRPTEAQTFLALRDRGMLNVKHPDESRILKFIRMSRPKTPLVTQKVREAEYTAFHNWIVAASYNPRLADAPSPPVAQRIGPAVPPAVIRHTRLDSVVASFTRNVWSQQGRCMNCHQAGTPDNKAKVKQFGQQVAWFKPDSAEDTMRTLIQQGDVDVDHLNQSLILLKPLGKVPHGGGVKMIYGDAGYKMFRAWAEDYAASVKGTYRTARNLPAPPQEALVDMNCVLAVINGPGTWQNKSVRVDVFPWDAATGAWSAPPAATGERVMSASRQART